MPVGQAAVASVVFRWRGELRVTAIVKATFAFAQGGEMPLVAPLPIVVTGVNHERSPARSVRQSADVAPYLERVDVLFCGHAHAPPNSPQPRVAVRLALPTTVVEAYAEVFFAVRPMRAATDWLLTHAVGYSALLSLIHI